MRKLPGRVTYPNITLKWGPHNRANSMIGTRTPNGKIRRMNGTIILLDDSGAEALGWNFFNAWPYKWDGPSFNAKGSDVAIETLELVCERIERA